MKQKQIILIILSFFFLGEINAQEKLSLDIETAKEYALNFNKTIKNSGLSIIQSQEKLKETIAQGLPQVNATTDYSNAMGAKISIQFDESAPATEIPIKPSSNFNLQVGQLIFSGSYLVGIQTARLFEKLSEKNLDKTEQDIICQVIESYYLVLVSEKSLEVLESNVKNLEDIYLKTQPMVEVGMLEKVELDQIQVQLNAVKNAVKSATRQFKMTQNMLRLLLGVSAETELELTETLSEIINGKTIDLTLGAPFEIGRNIDYQLITVQEQMSEKQINMQKASYLPTISGYYSFTHKILKPAFDMSPAHMAGFQMNIPVFSSGERRSKVRQAKLGLEITRNNKALLEDQLAIQFKQLQFNLTSALESYKNQEENIKVSREIYNSLKSKYEQGILSGLELTTADNNYLTAESQLLSATLEVLKAQNELNKLTGEITK